MPDQYFNQGAAGANRGGATGIAAGAAQLRLLRKRSVSNEAILDVRAEISAIEITDNDSLPSALRAIAPAALVSNDRYDSTVCLSPLSFAAFIGLGIILATSLSAFVFYTARPHHKF
ncbi:hypothetical protein TELCIR_26257 [Teladorsagia circumcincta]|uniref:Uncharacterized protein n=1 Tax=Teladorsagia circumcincta TaxID=45464 RepID=A0A2G9T3C0_TELCI|nr:hypothetical protein TELCIR_26257 [Teladorsagia circumcincta]